MGSKHLQEVNNIKYLVFVGKIIKDFEENFTKTSQHGDGVQCCGKVKTMLEVKKVSYLICINPKNHVTKNEKFKIIFIIVKTLFLVNHWTVFFAHQIMLAHSSFFLVYKGANICTSLLYI
jgi:hypothetical protein